MKKEEIKIAIIIPYFGKLPSWFQFFLLSCSKSKLIVFYLFTDDETDFDYPNNFKVFYKSFEEIQKLFKLKLNDEKIYLNHPYKLCDYKPCYGLVFEEYLKEYDFWGYCDVDIILGDVDKYLNKININLYDRVFNLGHFTLYKNSYKNNNSFKLKLNKNFPKYFDFDFISKTSIICNFDEVGTNVIMKEFDFKFYDKCLGANVNGDFIKFRLGDGKFTTNTILTYQDNCTYEVRMIDNGYVRNEYMYFHLQNRNDLNGINYSKSILNYVICNEGFIPYSESSLELLLKKMGGKELDSDLYQYRKNLKNKIRDRFFNKILKEWKYRKFYFFLTIIEHLKLKIWYSKK